VRDANRVCACVIVFHSRVRVISCSLSLNSATTSGIRARERQQCRSDLEQAVAATAEHRRRRSREEAVVVQRHQRSQGEGVAVLPLLPGAL
jgi:hypothetical protein